MTRFAVLILGVPRKDGNALYEAGNDGNWREKVNAVETKVNVPSGATVLGVGVWRFSIEDAAGLQSFLDATAVARATPYGCSVAFFEEEPKWIDVKPSSDKS